MPDTLAKSEKSITPHFHGSTVPAMKCTPSPFLYLLLLLLASVLIQPAFALDIEVRSTQVGLTPDYTRITLESGKPLEYELSMLDNPHRIIIDLHNSKISPALTALPQKINAIDPFVQKIRVGQFQPHVVRLVFDLKANAVPRTYVMPPKDTTGHRLVLDIRQSSGTDPMSRARSTDETGNTALEANVLDNLVTTLIQNDSSRKKQPPPAVRPQPSKPQSDQQQSGKTGSFQAAQNRKPRAIPRAIIIAIDPGHGGKDPGAIGSQGTHEKDITLEISRKLKARIDKEPNMRAVLTRTGDYYVSLPQRRINARRANADLFVSIHADANPKTHAHGSSVFTLSEHGATSTTASWLANKENSVDSDLMGGIDIASKSKDIKELLLDLSLNATINDSAKLAGHVLKQLGGINHLHKKKIEQAGFAVLKSPDIPSILVETAFLSNPREEEKLRNQNYQNKIADAMLQGIKNYFADNPALTRSEMAQVK